MGLPFYLYQSLCDGKGRHMKILLRRFDDKYYVWKDAEWKSDGYHIIHDDLDIVVREIEILAIKNDNRKGKVVCKNCGEIIDDNPEAIENHFTTQEAKRNCLTCSLLGTYDIAKNVGVTYAANGDGTYHQCINSDVKLRCKMSAWQTVDINSKDAKKICKFNQCRDRGTSKIEDFFTKYPGAFDKQITVDLLIKKGFTYEGYYSNYFWYDLKLRGGTLKACVNEMGVVDHFIVKHRDYNFNAYYSKKYDKLFFERYNTYDENTPGNMSETKRRNATEKIVALYKEVN